MLLIAVQNTNVPMLEADLSPANPTLVCPITSMKAGNGEMPRNQFATDAMKSLVSSRPVPAAFEFMATMMVVSVFMAISLGQARRTHIRVELIAKMLPARAQVAANLIRHGLSAAFFMAIAWFGILSAINSFNVGEYTPGSINFPVWPARFFLAAGVSLMTVQCVFDFLSVFWDRFDVKRHDTEASPPADAS